MFTLIVFRLRADGRGLTGGGAPGRGLTGGGAPGRAFTGGGWGLTSGGGTEHILKCHIWSKVIM